MKKIYSHIHTLLILCFVVSLLQTPATADNNRPNTSDPLQLIDTLKDDQKRAQLISDLEQLTLTQKQKNFNLKEKNTKSFNPFPDIKDIEQKIEALRETFTDFTKASQRLQTALSNPKVHQAFIDFLIYLTLLFIAGFTVEKAFTYIIHPLKQKIESQKNVKLDKKIFLILSRMVLTYVPIAAFIVTVLIIIPFLPIQPALTQTFYTFTYAYSLAHLIIIIYRAIFVPKVASIRILPIETAHANYFYSWVRRITLTFFYGWFLSEAIKLITSSTLLADFFLKILGLLITILCITFVLNNKKTAAKWLQNKWAQKSYLPKLKGSIASIWYLPVLLYIVYTYLTYLQNDHESLRLIIDKTAFTAFIIFSYYITTLLLQKFVTWFTNVEPKIFRKHPPLKLRAERYQSILRKVTSFITFITAVFFILETWEIHIFSLIMSPTGQTIFKSLGLIVFVIIVAFLIWEVTQNWISYRLQDTTHETDARMRTLLPLLRNITFIALCIFVTLIILSEVGVNIAPLLAGAGVLGLAIGIGSQALVKDLITGFFILIENTVTVGDVITVSGHTGIVEKMTIRTITLRDLAGSIHVIPFSEVTTFTNMTHHFSYALMEIGIAYKENVEEIMKELEILGQEIMEHPDFKDDILEPIEILGLDKFADSAVIIKARIKTKELQQWRIRRGFHLMMKKRFDEKGIEIPFPHVTVYAGNDPKGGTPSFKIEETPKATK